MKASHPRMVARRSIPAPTAKGALAPHPPAGYIVPDDSEDFRSGRVLVLPGGTDVRFDDARWTLKEQPCISVSFDDLPMWLREPTKRYVAVRWLDEGGGLTGISAAVTAARWWGRTIGETAARDLRDLSSDHVRQVRDQLAAEGERARAALEAAYGAATLEGRTLSQRERKRIVREAGGRLDLLAVSRYIDSICNVARSQLGWTVPFTVGTVANLAVEKRGPWSADASKVVSHEARRALVGVLDAEIAAYEVIRDRMRGLLASADYDAIAAADYDGIAAGRDDAGGEIPVAEEGCYLTGAHRARFVVDSVLGLNGRPMHSNAALALKLAPSSAPTIASHAKQYLGVYMTSSAIAEINKLRRAIFYRQKPVMGPDHERAQLLAIAAAHSIPGALQAQAEFGSRTSTPTVRAAATGTVQVSRTSADMVPDRMVLEAYFGIRDGTLWSIPEVSTFFDDGAKPWNTLRRINNCLPLLIGQAAARELLALRDRHDKWLSRAIKACALKLQLAVARRVGSLVNLDVEPKVETHHLIGTLQVVVHFRVWKGWGELGALDRVACPGELAHLAVEAIARTQELTAPLRARAASAVSKRLFLIPRVTSKGGRAIALRETSLHGYIFSGNENRDAGMLARYAEQLAAHDLQGYTLHHSRHTNATHLMEGGAAATTVSKYLGHNGGWNGNEATNTQQALVFYVAGGTETMRAVRAEHLSRGEGTGYLLDALLRVGAEGTPESQRAGWKGALELPLEEAMRRIQDADLIQPMPLTVADAQRAISERGVQMMATVWGGCLLPVEDGDCPAGPNGCSVGTHPDDPAVRQGCGCRWRALLPVALHHLEEDRTQLIAQLDVADARPELASARSKLRVELGIKDMEIATARRLNLLPLEEA